MKWFKNFKHVDDCRIDIVYEFFKEASGAIVVYNLGKRGLHDLIITIENENNLKYIYSIEEIPIKVGVKISYSTVADRKLEFFKGNISMIMIGVLGKQLRYTPLEGKPFMQL